LLPYNNRESPPDIAIQYSITVKPATHLFGLPPLALQESDRFRTFEEEYQPSSLFYFSTFTPPSFAVTTTFSALALVPDWAVIWTGNILPVSVPL
jgi:hypothetical protein